MGSLLSDLMEGVIRQVMALEDISADETVHLSDLMVILVEVRGSMCVCVCAQCAQCAQYA